LVNVIRTPGSGDPDFEYLIVESAISGYVCASSSRRAQIKALALARRPEHQGTVAIHALERAPQFTLIAGRKGDAP
jgi:hypothetical protein